MNMFTMITSYQDSLMRQYIHPFVEETTKTIHIQLMADVTWFKKTKSIIFIKLWDEMNHIFTLMNILYDNKQTF